MRRLEPILRRALRGPCALPPGRRLLVAVSGGADSTALLVGLASVAHEFGLALHAAHLHHGLRGADADRDLAFVRALCRRLGVPLTAARWDCRARMARRGLTGQAGLRTLRAGFLATVAARAGAAAIATAHTADDQAETVLMRLARGTGLAGLGGMAARRGRRVRPLLAATRAEIEADLRRIGQPWREDASNRDPRYTRSRVRHEALPALLRALGGRPDARARAGLARRVATAAREARDARRLVAARARGAEARTVRHRGGEIVLDSPGLGSYPRLIRRAVLRSLWSRIAPAAGGLTDRHLEALLSLLASPRGGARIQLACGWRAERTRDSVVLRRPAARSRTAGRAAVAARASR